MHRPLDITLRVAKSEYTRYHDLDYYKSRYYYDLYNTPEQYRYQYFFGLSGRYYRFYRISDKIEVLFQIYGTPIFDWRVCYSIESHHSIYRFKFVNDEEDFLRFLFCKK